MIDWVFIWSSRRAYIWDNVTNNINLALDDRYALPDRYFPAHIKNVVETYRDLVPNKENMRGQLLDQFEAESFKYIMDATHDQKLLIKENLQIKVLTNETNSRIIDLDEVGMYLEKYKWVALGVVLSNVEISDKTLVAKSFYYTRDPETLQIINLSGDNQPYEHTHLPVITYSVFKKTSDPSIYISVMNPNLISLANIETAVLGNHRVTTFNGFEDGVDTFFTKPTIIGARVMNNSVIFAENDFEIHEFVNSAFHQRTGKIPTFPKIVETNFYVNHHNDVMKVMINQPIGYISITYDIDGLINNYDDRTTAGKHKVDFMVVRG
jgi:hypothetical protein